MTEAIIAAIAAGHHTTRAIAKHLATTESITLRALHDMEKTGAVKRERAARRQANTWMVGDKVPAYTTAGWRPYTKPREAPRRPGADDHKQCESKYAALQSMVDEGQAAGLYGEQS